MPSSSTPSIDASPTQVNVLPLSQPGFTQQARQAAASTVETALSPAPTSAPVPGSVSPGPPSEWYGSESEESDVEGEDEARAVATKTTKPTKHTTLPRRSPPPVNEELEAQASNASKDAQRANPTGLSSSAKESSTTSPDPSDPATLPLSTDGPTGNTEDADPSANNTYFRIARVLLVVIVILLLLYLVYWVIANVFQVDVGAWFGWGSSVDGTDGAGVEEGVSGDTTGEALESFGMSNGGVDSGVDSSGIDMEVGAGESGSGNAMESYAPSPSTSAITSTTTPEAGLGSMMSAPAFSNTPTPSPPLASSGLSPPVGQVTAKGPYGNVQMQQGLSERSAEALLDLMSRME